MLIFIYFVNKLSSMQHANEHKYLLFVIFVSRCSLRNLTYLAPNYQGSAREFRKIFFFNIFYSPRPINLSIKMNKIEPCTVIVVLRVQSGRSRARVAIKKDKRARASLLENP